MFVVIKKKTIIVASILLIAIVASCVALAVVLVPSERATAGDIFTVVLDAGHGGIDVGVKGVNSGALESDVNLELVLETKRLLEEKGVAVVLTRTDENGLYDSTEQGFKKRDLEKRKEIISSSGADCVVSIHCNKFPDPNRRGAQCFFEELSPSSIALATAIQNPLNTLNERETSRTYTALKGNYYMLKCSSLPSAIVECGFLSNEEDDALLNSPTYRTELCNRIVDGILAYRDTLSQSST